MTRVECKLKEGAEEIDVSGSLIDRLDIWGKVTDGVGRFKVKLKNNNGEWLGQFKGDDLIRIKIGNAIFLGGYLDEGYPITEDRKGIYQQTYELIGRDFGQDLQSKIVNKTGDWMYKKQHADDIIDDMLAKISSEISFASPHTAPEIQYTDTGDEFLIEAFRKIWEKINYDAYVDETKTLKMFPIGSINSGIVLKSVAGASDNNILGPIKKTEFDTYELRNYMVVKSGDINDGWSEGNPEDFVGASGNTISNEFLTVHAGAASIKCEKGTADHCELGLVFPKHYYDYLPFDLFGSETVAVWLWIHVPDAGAYPWPLIEVILEDTNGNRIRYCWSVYLQTSFKRDVFFQYTLPIGTECKIKDYPNGRHRLTWHYADEASTSFNWKIKKVIFSTGEHSTTLILDGLRIPLPMVSYVNDNASGEDYKVRYWPVMAKDVYSQRELDEFAQSELEKRKNPVTGLKITAIGAAGIIGGINKWIPGYNIQVNAPNDGINNEWYRMAEVHVAVADGPIISGHDFVAEVTLVPHTAEVSGKRLSYVETPEIALLRALSDRIRFLEKKEEGKRDWWPPLPGTLSADQLEDLDASKIISGTFPWSRILGSFPRTIEDLLDNHDLPHHPLGIIPIMDLPHIPNLPASIITSGVFGTGRIPGLDTSKIISGVFTDPRIPGLDAGKIISGTFPLSRIPNINWGRISGNFPRSIWADIFNTKFGIDIVLTDHNLTNHPLDIVPNMDWGHISSLFPRSVWTQVFVTPTFTDLKTLLNSYFYFTGENHLGLPSGKVLLPDYIAPLPASRIVSGVFDDARIPSLDASKIFSGIFAEPRIPHTFTDWMTMRYLRPEVLKVGASSNWLEFTDIYNYVRLRFLVSDPGYARPQVAGSFDLGTEGYYFAKSHGTGYVQHSAPPFKDKGKALGYIKKMETGKKSTYPEYALRKPARERIKKQLEDADEFTEEKLEETMKREDIVGVDLGSLINVCVEAIKELTDEVDKLTAKVEELEPK